MKQGNQLKKMFAALALGGLMLVAPQLANADIASDIAAGRDAAVVAQQAVRGGMAPVAAALAAVQAAPQSAAAIAVAVAQENPDAVTDVAVAVVQAQPEQAVAVVQALTQRYPDRAMEIAAMAARAICGDDKRDKYMKEKRQDLLDVCSGLYAMYPGIEAYEGDTTAPPVVDTTTLQDQPASPI